MFLIIFGWFNRAEYYFRQKYNRVQFLNDGWKVINEFYINVEETEEEEEGEEKERWY